MKICFVLQRRFVIVGHSMSVYLKRHYEDVEFCALVGMRQSLKFLKNQEDIQYTSLLLEEDIHKKLYEEKIDKEYLQWLEEEYGIPNLWPYLYVDRVIMNGQLVREYPYNKASLSHEQMMKRLQVTAKAIIEFLDREKPDILFLSVIGSTGSSLLYHIAQKRGIKTITIELTRMNNRATLSETYKGFSWAKKRYDEIQKGGKSPEEENAKKFLEEFRNCPVTYRKEVSLAFTDRVQRSANLVFLKPSNLFLSSLWHIRRLFEDIRKIGKSDYTDISIWWLVWDKLNKKIRGLIGYTDLYSPLNTTERFAYYPLHYDPEMATLLYAPRYTDQIHVIKQIARSLPIDMKLYVKEHPVMVGHRPRAYYKELLKIPNVKLISPAVNGLDIVRQSAIVLTITGSGGWEAVLLKKPVITFGDVFYNDIPGVKRSTDYDQLPFLVKEQLNSWEHNEQSVVDYVSSLLEDSIPVDYIDLWLYAKTMNEVIDNKGIKQLSRSFAKKIGLQTLHE